MTQPNAWGSSAMKSFIDLSPDQVMDAVETLPIRCTGRLLQLNSMENRVYEFEIENQVPEEMWQNETAPDYPKLMVAKFYRPGRWNKEQIADEHQFLKELFNNDLSVVAPFEYQGQSFWHHEGLQLFFCLYPKRAGRTPYDLPKDEWMRLGRLIARMHMIGETKNAPHRLTLDPVTYGDSNIQNVLSSEFMPEKYRDVWADAAKRVLDIIRPRFEGVRNIRIHGDLHFGNVLYREAEGPILLDFDDFLNGPAIQDIWLLTPGRDESTMQFREWMLEGYEQMREFPWHDLPLVEALRTLRYLHFSAWISKRFHDPSFKITFPHFGSDEYWREQVSDLYEQIEVLTGG